MLHLLRVPKWGLSMERAKVLVWLREEGSAVEIGTGLVEIESEKIANELQSEHSGVLRSILAPVGMLVAVGDPLAVIASEHEPDAIVEEFVGALPKSSATDEVEDTGPKRAQIRVGPHLVSYLALQALQCKNLPVVLVHGFGGDATTWQLNAPVFAAKRAVFALDLPGHGLSSRELQSGSLEELSGALEGFIAALSLDRFHLVGHSLGSAIALRIARKDSTRIASLSLLSPVGLGIPVDPGFIDGFVRAESRKEVKRVLEQLFANGNLITSELVEKVQQGKRLDGARQALEKIAASNFLTDGGFVAYDPDLLLGLGMRALIIAGAADRVIAFGKGFEAANNTQLSVLPGVGHMPQIEAAQAVNRLLEEAFTAHDDSCLLETNTE
jgi:pyruvate dehydrogenase E2 component (dihydrolipoyllysine-residue acetyltransferase)